MLFATCSHAAKRLRLGAGFRPPFSGFFLSMFLSVLLSVHQSIYLVSYLSNWKLEKEIVLRNFLNYWTWQHPKRRDSARLSSNMRRWLLSWWPQSNAFCDSSIPAVWTALATKKWCQGIRSVAPVTQIIFPKLKIRCAKVEPLSRHKRAHLRNPPNISAAHVSCTAPATWHASFQILLKCPTPPIICYHTLIYFCSCGKWNVQCVWDSWHDMFCIFWNLDNCRVTQRS